MQKVINKKRLYGVFQITGWSLYYLFFTIIASIIYELHWQIFASYGVSAVVGIVLTHQYRNFIIRKNWLELSFWRLSKRLIVSSLIISAIWLLFTVPITDTFFELDIESQITGPGMYILLWIQMSTLIFGWSLIYFGFNFFYNYKRSEIEKWQLDAAAREAELSALKSQINPHFIFNSLNNIKSLIVEDPEKSREMITHLSGLLRYSIEFNNQEKVKLGDELEIVKNYLKLESIQLEDRLQYKLEIDPATLEHQVPPMVVQLLVENAIKHGISGLTKGGEIRINSKLEGNSLIVEVKNTGSLKDVNARPGIGLKNASERLSLLFGKLSDIKMENIPGGMVSAKFSIPIN